MRAPIAAPIPNGAREGRRPELNVTAAAIAASRTEPSAAGLDCGTGAREHCRYPCTERE
jgi:hypothetical protein